MLDLAETVKASRRFYRDHALADWLRAIPKSAAIAAGYDSAGQQAEKAGFVSGFVFPPFALQLEQVEPLIEATARRPSALLPDSAQYSGEVFRCDGWSKTPNGKVLQRRDDLAGRDAGPYLLRFAPAPFATAWGRSGRQIQELFHAKGWQGLTVPEYFVLQRWFSERLGDHRFFAENHEDRTTHSLWLIDSMSGADCSVAVGGPRGINVQGCSAGNRDARRATVAALVVPLRAAQA